METRHMTKEQANDVLPTNFDGAIARGDELTLLGDYGAALTLLESLGAEPPCNKEQNRRILRAKARTWVARGYPQRAKECIHKACALPREDMNEQQTLILEIHDAFVTIVACGEEIENDELLSQVRKLLSTMGVLISFSTDAVGSDRD